MPWGRLDDQANGNAKLLALSDSAWRLWGCGLIYCQANLTDGFIPDHAIHSFGVRARNKTVVAEELCKSLVPGKGPLWHKANGGYQVHDYLHWNDSREAVLAERANAKARMALVRDPELRRALRTRDGDVCRYCGTTVNWSDRKGPSGATYDHVDPHGDDTLDNLAVCCRRCNTKKGQRTPEAAGMTLKELSRSDLDPHLSQIQVGLSVGSSTHVPQPPVPSEPQRDRARRPGPATGLLKPHGNVAFEGPRVYVPWQVHHKLTRLRNHAGASDELMAFYQRVSDEWTDGSCQREEPGADMFAFWTARYNEHWPPTKAHGSTQLQAGPVVGGIEETRRKYLSQRPA